MEKTIYWLFGLTFVLVVIYAGTGKTGWFYLAGFSLLAMVYIVFEKRQIPKTDFWLLALSMIFAMIFAARGKIGWLIFGTIPLLVMLYRANFQESKQGSELESE